MFLALSDHAFPFHGHRLATTVDRINYQAVMAAAIYDDYTPEAKQGLLQAFSITWDPHNGIFVPFDETSSTLVNIANVASHDLFQACVRYERQTDEIFDPQKSEILRHRLTHGLSDKYLRLLDDVGLSPHEILNHYDLLVSLFTPEDTIAIMGSYGVVYSSPKHRRIFVASDLKGLDYLLLCFLPGVVSGLYDDVGYMLNRIIINLLIGEPGIYRYTATKVILDALAVNGLPVRKTLIEALQGNPEKLYQAIINQYDWPGLGNLLLIGGSDFFSDTTGPTRYGLHYGCAMEYFSQFGYHLNAEGD